jgi:hypothetical protein
MMAHNTKERAAAILTAALDIVTPDVQAELDQMLADSRDVERAQTYRDLERMLRAATECSHPTSRQAIAKAMRLRRGQAIETDKRGGFNPANAGDNHWKRHK